MYPSSWSRRAISSFMREVGMEAVSCSARFALRMRVSMSAIGSVSIVRLLPARLRHARDRALVCEVAQADAAKLVPPVHRPRAPAAVAARVGGDRVLRRALLLRSQRLLGHVLLVPSLGREREAERLQQRAGMLVRLRGGGDGDVQAAHGGDAVVVDLGEDDLLPD